MAAAMPPFEKTRLLFRCPALFTRSCRFHHGLSTTSSATRATKLSLITVNSGPEKAGVGGSTPSLATIILNDLHDSPRRPLSPLSVRI